MKPLSKILALFISCTIAFSSYAKSSKKSVEKSSSSSTTTRYLSVVVPSIYTGQFMSYDSNTHEANMVDVNTLPHNKSFLNLFPNTQSSISIFQEDDNGNLSVIGNSLSLDKGTYKVIYEFSQFQPQSSTSANDTSNATTYCVGVSVRLIASIYTKKGNLDLSKILNVVGLTAASSKLSGQLEISIKGINSPTLTSLNPIPNGATLTTDNITTALQAIAAIKSHFSDDSVTIAPEVLGFYQSTINYADKDAYQKTVQKIQSLQSTTPMKRPLKQ